MNFPLFHQVIVAGGLDPELRHSRKAIRETEKGSSGSDMVTLTGKTEKQNGTHKKSDSKNMSGESLFAGKYQRNYFFFIFFLLIAFFNDVIISRKKVLFGRVLIFKRMTQETSTLSVRRTFL